MTDPNSPFWDSDKLGDRRDHPEYDPEKYEETYKKEYPNEFEDDQA